jgi:hypothetical protein
MKAKFFHCWFIFQSFHGKMLKGEQNERRKIEVRLLIGLFISYLAPLENNLNVAN